MNKTEKMGERQSWDDFFFDVAKQISTRSTCLRWQYGCVLVRDKTILSTGFNGAPRGYPHCLDIGCAKEGHALGEHSELCRATHAEQNAVANAARMGVCIMGSELYVHLSELPCPLCAKILINAGVAKIHYKIQNYPDYYWFSKDLFDATGVELIYHG